MTLRIDPMLPSDWPAVREIYLEGIATRQATFETEAFAWEAWDASHSPFARLVARLHPPVASDLVSAVELARE